MYMPSIGSDKKLPQIGRMRDLLLRGIGVHHGGLLPLVKEVGHLLTPYSSFTVVA
jgi:antiviral helicase SKI2